MRARAEIMRRRGQKNAARTRSVLTKYENLQKTAKNSERESKLRVFLQNPSSFALAI